MRPTEGSSLSRQRCSVRRSAKCSVQRLQMREWPGPRIAASLPPDFGTSAALGNNVSTPTSSSVRTRATGWGRRPGRPAGKRASYFRGGYCSERPSTWPWPTDLVRPSSVITALLAQFPDPSRQGRSRARFTATGNRSRPDSADPGRRRCPVDLRSAKPVPHLRTTARCTKMQGDT